MWYAESKYRKNLERSLRRDIYYSSRIYILLKGDRL